MEHHNSFCSPWRRCAACGTLKAKGTYARCSKCKVFVYCNKECQFKHWKDEHKASCRAQSCLPPPLPALSLPVETASDDLDKPYRYIQINPPSKNKMTRDEWLTTAQGVTDEQLIEDLDTLILAQPGEQLNSTFKDPEKSDSPEQRNRERIIKKLQTRNRWDTIASSPVPGFSASYDGYTLRRLYDDNSKFRPELGGNRSAEVLCMQGNDTLNGTMFVWCAASGAEAKLMAKALNKDRDSVDTDPMCEIVNPSASTTLPADQDPDGSCVPRPPPDVIVPITRRSVLETIEHNEESGALGAVPERIHFENISRTSGLAYFKKQNFTVL